MRACTCKPSSILCRDLNLHRACSSGDRHSRFRVERALMLHVLFETFHPYFGHPLIFEAFSIISLNNFSSPCSQSCCSSMHIRGLDITMEFFPQGLYTAFSVSFSLFYFLYCFSMSDFIYVYHFNHIPSFSKSSDLK